MKGGNDNYRKEDITERGREGGEKKAKQASGTRL